jgi:single-strand DNA-binding protein
MAIHLNRAILVGRLGGEPEARGQGGLALSVATSETWTDKQTGERQERTQWHKVVIWNEHVVKFVSQYASKGDLVCVEGQIETRKYTDRDGIERWTTEIVVKQYNGNVQVLSKSTTDQMPGETRPAPAPKQQPKKEEPKRSGGWNKEMDDEIPF